MKKLVGVMLLSLTLLGPAHFAFAGSEEEQLLMRLDRLEKQIQTIQATIKIKMAEGKSMSGGKMKDAMKMVETIERAVRTAADWWDQA